MSTSYRVILTLRASEHLQQIFDFIEQDSAQNAARMIERILDAIDALDHFPHRYKVVENSVIIGEEIRSMPVPPYRVRYQIDDRGLVVAVLSIRHGARQAND